MHTQACLHLYICGWLQKHKKIYNRTQLLNVLPGYGGEKGMGRGN